MYVHTPYIRVMAKEGIRKEVFLNSKTIDVLQSLADKKKWHLKVYMEYVLTREAVKFSKKKTP